MTASERSRRAVLNAIARLSQQFQHFGVREIARVSTYSPPTVLKAISDLERDGYIEVDRSNHEQNPAQPYSYTILREMEPEKEEALRCC